jgi:hypothetical protein
MIEPGHVRLRSKGGPFKLLNKCDNSGALADGLQHVSFCLFETASTTGRYDDNNAAIFRIIFSLAKRLALSRIESVAMSSRW